VSHVDTIPGTAVSLPRRSAECVLAATRAPVKPTEGQGDLVEHWTECGLLTTEQRTAMGREES
jgi:hypothetical protein